MSGELQGKTVAILATDGFEQVELFSPKAALETAGAKVEVISLKGGDLQGFDHIKPGKTCKVDRTLDDAKVATYDALVLPGGCNNPDSLRTEEAVQAFVRGFFDAGKPVAAICHAPWILIDAGVAKGRRLTSYKTIRTDLKNAGANVVNEEVVVDGGLITSRCPDDLPAFNAKLIEAVAKGWATGGEPAARPRAA